MLRRFIVITFAIALCPAFTVQAQDAKIKTEKSSMAKATT